MTKVQSNNQMKKMEDARIKLEKLKNVLSDFKKLRGTSRAKVWRHLLGYLKHDINNLEECGNDLGRDYWVAGTEVIFKEMWTSKVTNCRLIGLFDWYAQHIAETNLRYNAFCKELNKKTDDK